MDGKKALEYAAIHIVDVVFLDMEMPGLHGLALAMKLREIVTIQQSTIPRGVLA